MRLIDADKLKIPGEELIAKMAIALAPIIDPVKHGKWIRGGEGDDIWLCSECESIFNCRMKYCGNCSAKMNEEEDEANS